MLIVRVLQCHISYVSGSFQSALKSQFSIQVVLVLAARNSSTVGKDISQCSQLGHGKQVLLWQWQRYKELPPRCAGWYSTSSAIRFHTGRIFQSSQWQDWRHRYQYLNCDSYGCISFEQLANVFIVYVPSSLMVSERARELPSVELPRIVNWGGLLGGG